MRVDGIIGESGQSGQFMGLVVLWTITKRRGEEEQEGEGGEEEAKTCQKGEITVDPARLNRWPWPRCWFVSLFWR